MAYSDDLFRKRDAGKRSPNPEARLPAGVSSGELDLQPAPAPSGASEADLLRAEIDRLRAEKISAEARAAIGAAPPPAVPKSPSNWQGWALTILLCAFVILLVAMFRKWNNDDGIVPDEVGDGPAVLVVYESDPDESEASPDQKIALSSVKVKRWLDENCPDLNGRKAWRMYDQHVELDNDEEVFQKLMKKPRDSVPWLYMSGGRRIISEAMVDGDEDEFIEQLEKGK